MKIGATATQYGPASLELLERQIAESRGGDSLGTLTVGSKVNLETDILAKYVQRLAEAENWPQIENGGL